MLSLLSDNSGSFQVVSKGRLVLLLTVQITGLPGHRHTRDPQGLVHEVGTLTLRDNRLSDEVSGAPQPYHLVPPLLTLTTTDMIDFCIHKIKTDIQRTK